LLRGGGPKRTKEGFEKDKAHEHDAEAIDHKETALTKALRPPLLTMAD